MPDGIAYKHTFQSAAAATANGEAMNVAGLGLAGVQITGTFTATVTFEGTIDGSTWVSVLARNVADGTTSATATAPAVFQVPAAGLAQVRARVSAYTSGAITVVGHGVYAAGLNLV